MWDLTSSSDRADQNVKLYGPEFLLGKMFSFPELGSVVPCFDAQIGTHWFYGGFFGALTSCSCHVHIVFLHMNPTKRLDSRYSSSRYLAITHAGGSWRSSGATLVASQRKWTSSSGSPSTKTQKSIQTIHTISYYDRNKTLWSEYVVNLRKFIFYIIPLRSLKAQAFAARPPNPRRRPAAAPEHPGSSRGPKCRERWQRWAAAAASGRTPSANGSGGSWAFRRGIGRSKKVRKAKTPGIEKQKWRNNIVKGFTFCTCSAFNHEVFVGASMCFRRYRCCPCFVCFSKRRCLRCSWEGMCS